MLLGIAVGDAYGAGLYHVTVEQFLLSIREKGMFKGQRHHPPSATNRPQPELRGEPMILRVRGRTMHADAHAFFRRANGVWLTDAQLPHYVEYPP